MSCGRWTRRVGVWDPVGIVASLALAIGGVAIGAWGFRRRDLHA